MGRAVLLLSILAGAGACRRARDPESRKAAAFSAYVLATHRRSARYELEPAPFATRLRAGGFTLADDLGCDDGRGDAYCAAAVPKRWTAGELRRVADELENLRTGGLDPLLARARADGFTTLLRTAYVAQRAPGGAWRRLPYPNSLHVNGQILIADRRFRAAGERPLLHLLVHAADFAPRGAGTYAPRFSDAPEFLRLTGFSLDARGNWQLASMPSAQRALFLDLFDRTNRDLLAAGALPDGKSRRRREAAIRARAERFARPYRAPSFHSLESPYEALAEWAVLVHLDPARARALNPGAARWVLENVLAPSAVPAPTSGR